MDSKSPVKARFLKFIVTLSCRNPWLTLSLALLLAGGGLFLTITRLGYISNTNDLIRQDATFHQYYLNYMKEFEVGDEFLVLIQGPDFERNKQCLEQLATNLKTSNRFSEVFYRIDFAALEKRFLLFLPLDDLKKMETSLNHFIGMMTQNQTPILDLNSMLNQANRMFDEEFLREESNWDEFKPFVANFVGNLNALANQIEGIPQNTKTPSLGALMGMEGGLDDLEKLKRENEYLAFDEGKTLLLILSPREKNEEDLSPHAKNIQFTREIIKQARQKFPDLTIGLTGEPVLDADQIESSMKSVSLATIITLVLIASLFLLSYHEFGRPFLAILTLIIATLWTFGFTVLTIGHLNIISNAFAAMILGLGIDFSIQLLGRYEEELSRGLNYLTALQEASIHTGTAIFTGALTTAAAFFTMCFNDFSGLAELGIIAGSGILLCFISTFTVFPACLALIDRNQKNLAATTNPNHWRAGFLLKEPFSKHPSVIIIITILLTAFSAYYATKTRFDYNLLNLQNPKLESVDIEHKLLKSDAKSVIFAVSTANSIEEARAKAEKFKALSTVRNVMTLSEILPTQQEEKLSIVRRIVARLQQLNLNTDISDKVDVERAQHELSQLLQQSREGEQQASKYVGLSKRARDARDTFAKLIPALQRAVNAFKNQNQTELGQRLNAYQVNLFQEIQRMLRWLVEQETSRGITEADIPPQLLDRYQGKTGKILIEITPKENVWDREPSERFVQELRTVDPEITGTPVQNYEYLAVLKNAFQQAAWYALIVICIAILLHFRSIKHLILTLIPLALGIVWTLGVMGATNLQFNPANIITLPLVIGIGVAYGLYAVDRFKEDPHKTLFDTSTGKAVWLSALTTIFGFGSLIQASYRGISSLGLLMTLGVSMCLITSLYILPAFMKFFSRKPKPEINAS